MQEIPTALYRKYRPATFDEVRNQDHIVSVLQGAIKKKAIPHALLFVGSRGIGKTTVARIFAHEIGARDIDIYEIDAASNRGIDDIRALNDAVRTLPYESAYKVYIIDEVHMLTKEAFNALLKTLEEPPAHVVFVLATTEYEKLLPTIISRCQVFEFKSPSRQELKETVLAVAKKEKFKLEGAAADLIAIAADGAFRDALGITQKVILASDDQTASPDEVARIVGAPRSALIIEFINAIVEKDAERGLTAIQQAVDAGADMKLFLRLILERLRAVILIRHSKKEHERFSSELGDDEGKLLFQLAQAPKSPINSHLLLRFLSAFEQMGKMYLPQIPLELALVEVCTPNEA